MESLDLKVLEDARNWPQTGSAVTLDSVVETWGSASCPPGALLAVRGDSVASGSVSGGCVEDDLIARTKIALNHPFMGRSAMPAMIARGVSKEEAARFGLSCGGSLRLVQEPVHATVWIDVVLQCTAAHQLKLQRAYWLRFSKSRTCAEQRRPWQPAHLVRLVEFRRKA